MTRDAKVLVTSGGRRVELLELFRKDALALHLRPHIVVGDARPELSAAAHAADESHRLPRADAPTYADAVLELAIRAQARLVVPTIDIELAALAARRDDFASHGILVAVSSPSAVAIARDKFATHECLRGAGIPTPHTMTAHDALSAPDGLRWPVMAKPRGGSSSIGIFRPATPAELALKATETDELIVQQLLAGPEYTVNFFCNADGSMETAIPHRRIETRAGEVSKGITVRHEALIALARRIAAALPGLFGALCFQAIDTAEGPFVFEINARFGGGFPLAHRAGAPFTRWLLEDAAALPRTRATGWKEGVLMLRHDRSLFTQVDPEGKSVQ